ncbi:nucleolar protein 16 [Nilaparvata lugens]|uniref:nucleolar protein 16 n=1 Tax=Nilaparvata lugens TaxID=108931 RepID=UPI00193E0FAD|nr:nucleolar protein 16 [Nilaparvata lugens]
MPKIHKVRRRQRFRYGANRKRANKRTVKGPTIQCEILKEEWNKHASVINNFKNMGLAFNPNLAVGIPKNRVLPASREKDEKQDKVQKEQRKAHKGHVMKELEEDANAPRERKFRLPNSTVQQLTYYLDKYGEDYKAMAKDPKNYYQETWKQLRAKVKQFKGVPEQFEKYLAERAKKMEVDS